MQVVYNIRSRAISGKWNWYEAAESYQRILTNRPDVP